MGILDLIKILNKGEELTNPAVWKNAQALMTVVGALLGYFVQYSGIEISEDFKTPIIWIISGVVVIANIFFTYATSKKVGLGKEIIDD